MAGGRGPYIGNNEFFTSEAYGGAEKKTDDKLEAPI